MDAGTRLRYSRIAGGRRASNSVRLRFEGEPRSALISSIRCQPLTVRSVDKYEETRRVHRRSPTARCE